MYWPLDTVYGVKLVSASFLENGGCSGKNVNSIIHKVHAKNVRWPLESKAALYGAAGGKTACLSTMRLTPT